jgi:putative ABC transport system permease protein
MRVVYSVYFDAARIALQSIFAHKLRSFLTLIGIIIGVASVVVVGASINGLNAYVVDKVSRVLGTNHFMLARMAHMGEMTEDEWKAMDKRNPRLDWDDFRWVAGQCSTCSQVGAELETNIDIKQSGETLYGVDVSGVTANMVDIEDKTIADGRFLVDHEVEHAALVCVLGMDLRDKYFPGVDPIGKTLAIQDVPFTVVGVEQRRGSMFGQSLDKNVYIPVTTYQKLFGRRQSLQIHGQAADVDAFERTLDQARMSMRIRHKLKGDEKDDFGLVNVREVNNGVDQFTGAIALVVTPITFLSLVVGGIVVMNIMLVSVTERTFEIGLRKALGARRAQILLQFLIESSILAAFGGLFGLLLAAGIAWLINVTTPVPMTITVGYVALSLGVSGAIGMLFGIYPAFKAARLDPIVALTRS